VKATRTVELASTVEVKMTSVSTTSVLPPTTTVERTLPVVILRSFAPSVLTVTTAMEDCEFNSVKAPSAVEVTDGPSELCDPRAVDADNGALEVSVQSSVELRRLVVPCAVEVIERRMVEVSAILSVEIGSVAVTRSVDVIDRRVVEVSAISSVELGVAKP